MTANAPVLSGSRAGIWVVMPAYNEAARIRPVVRALLAAYPDLIVVDDGSGDGTAEAVAGEPCVLIRHPVNLGQGAALATGIRYAVQAGARCVVTFDADGQHEVADIDRIVEPVLSGRAEVALGSRFLGTAVNMPRSRHWILKAGVLFTRIFSGLAVTDTHNGLRCLSRTAAKAIQIRENRMAHASEILDEIAHRKLTYAEVPVAIHYNDQTLAKGQKATNSLLILLRLLFGRMFG